MRSLITNLVLFVVLTQTLSCQTKSNSTIKYLELSTAYGNMTIELYDNTPMHRENFIKLVRDGYYDGQIFHRMIKNFMIQGGDPNSRDASKGELLGQGGPSYTIPAEIQPGNFHKKGALAAARKGDDTNPARESSGSQFYIVQGTTFTLPQLEAMVERNMHKPFTDEEIQAYTTVGGTPHLDAGYTVFGEVTEGLDVLDKLLEMPVDDYDRPLTDIVFTLKIK